MANVNCPCVYTFLRDSLWMHQHEIWRSTIYMSLAISSSSQGSNERWQLMSKLVQLTGTHFPDLSPNSCDNLYYMKWNLNVSTKIKFSVDDQGL